MVILCGRVSGCLTVNYRTKKKNTKPSNWLTQERNLLAHIIGSLEKGQLQGWLMKLVAPPCHGAPEFSVLASRVGFLAPISPCRMAISRKPTSLFISSKGERAPPQTRGKVGKLPSPLYCHQWDETSALIFLRKRVQSRDMEKQARVYWL